MPQSLQVRFSFAVLHRSANTPVDHASVSQAVEFQFRKARMRSVRRILTAVCVGWLCASAADADEQIKSRSPNGKFAMRLAGDVSEIVDLKSKKTILELEEVSGSWAKDSKLLWSSDSKCFAHFSADRRGGSTTIYRQKGDAEFEQVSIPEFPDCEKTNVGKEFETSVEPKRWSNATTLVLVAREAWSDEDDPDKTSECERTITISFDASGKASIKNIKKGKK